MKKTYSILLVPALLLTMSACAQDPVTTSAPTTQSTSVATTAVPSTETTSDAVADYEGKMSSVSFPTAVDERYADKETVISVYRYPDFTLSLPDADIAEIISLDLLNRVDATAAAAEAVHEAAKRDYSSNSDFYQYYYDVSYSVKRLDQNVLSFYCTESSYDGSPRSVQSQYSISYDLTTGNELNLRSILQEDYSADVLCELVIEGLSSYDPTQLFPDHQTTINDKFSTNVPVDTWYFTERGLCFYFAPYEIAPVSLGAVVSEIPYDKLSGMLSEQFFPAEQLNYLGEANIKDITGNIDSATKAYTQFSELTLQTGANQLLLTSDGSIIDLRIYEIDPDNIAQNTMIYAAAGLGPTDALLIETDINALDQSILIEYKTNGETRQLHPKLASDGSIDLIE